MLVSFSTQTITVLRGVEVTDHGNTVIDFNTPAEHDVTGCTVVPADDEEQLDHRDSIYAEFKVLAPPHADILPRDRVRYTGTEYRIKGSVKPVPSPTGGLDHKDLTIGSWRG